MEERVPRFGISLDALMAEAKRRARQRRLLLAVFGVAAVAVGATVAFHPWGSGTPSGRAAGTLNGVATRSEVLYFGAFALTVPKGFYVQELRRPRGALDSIVVENREPGSPTP